MKLSHHLIFALAALLGVTAIALSGVPASSRHIMSAKLMPCDPNDAASPCAVLNSAAPAPTFQAKLIVT